MDIRPSGIDRSSRLGICSPLSRFCFRPVLLEFVFGKWGFIFYISQVYPPPPFFLAYYHCRAGVHKLASTVVGHQL